MHEVHIQDDGARLAKLSRALPDLRLNRQCDPKLIPLGTVCYEYPFGRERELEAAARVLDLSFEWGVVGFRVFGFTQIGTRLYLVNQPNDKLFIVNAANPASMSILASYDLSGDFAVNQTRLQGVCGAGNFLYVQGLGENGVSNGTFAVYNVSNPLIVTQRDTLDYGQPASAISDRANWLVGPSNNVVFGIWDGDGSTTACVLRSIDVTDPDNISIIQTVNVGTFADQPRRAQLVGTTLYVLSGTTGSGIGNQKVFVFNVTNPAAMTLSATILIADDDAQGGVQNFSVQESDIGKISIMANNADEDTVNLVVYTTAGAFLNSTKVYDGISTTKGNAIATKVAV